MAVAIRGTTPATAGTGSATVSVTVNGTRQPQAGDVLLIIHCNDFYALANMPSPTVDGSTTGVTAITGGTVDAGASSAHLKAYYWVNSSTADRTVSVTETGSADEEKALVVYVLSGVDTTTPIDGSAAGTFSASGTTPWVLAAASPSTADAYLIGHVNSGGGGTAGGSSTPPGSMSEQYDSVVAGAMLITGATEQLSASGSTGTRTFTPAAAGSFAGVLIPVKTAAASGSNFTRTVDDGTGLTDAATPSVGYSRTQTDVAGLVDTRTVVSAHGRSQTDSAGFTDSLVQVLATQHTRSVTDEIGLSDTGDLIALDVGETITDSTGLVDTITAVSALARTLTDAAGLTDSASAQLNAGGTAFTRTVNDSAGLTDTAPLALAAARAITDSAGLTDSATAELSSALSRAVADSIGLADTVSLSMAAARLASDSLGLTDSVLAELNLVTVHVRTITDDIGLRSEHQVKRTIRRPYTGVISRYPFVPD